MLHNARLFPASPLAALRSVNRLFDALEPFGRGAVVSTPAFPAVNLWDDGESLHVEAEVPGMKMENLELLVVGNELTIKGHRPDGANGTGTIHRQERGTGEFTRVITLPYEVNASKVDATLKDGVLAIVMPKAESARARKIEVKML